MEYPELNYERLGPELEKAKEMFVAIESVFQNLDFRNPFSLDRLIDLLARNTILMVLDRTNYNQVQTAFFLGTVEQNLRYQMKRLQIPSARSHPSERSHDAA